MGPVGKFKMNRKILERTQRMAAIRILRAHRTTSYRASVYLSGITPIMEKIDTVIKLKNHFATNMIKLNSEQCEIEKRDKRIKIHPGKTPIIRSNKKIDVTDLGQNSIKIFTDGSKMDGAVGCAFVVYDGQAEVMTKKYKLGPHCSVFQSELWAIYNALQTALGFNREGEAIFIVSDSQSAILAIENVYTDNPIVDLIHDSLLQLQEKRMYAIFMWARSHIGIEGN